MNRVAICIGIVFLACGCATIERFEIDLAEVEDFDWNGKVRVTVQNHGLFAGWKVEHVELGSDDDTAVSLNTTRIKPVVHLIGDPKQHQSSNAKVTIRKAIWFGYSSRVQEESFSLRSDLGNRVDQTRPPPDEPSP